MSFQAGDISIVNCLKNALESSLDIFYEGDGNKIARTFYIPVLRQSSSYKRVSGYFSIDSLVVVATGLAGLIKNDGKMNLVLGAHDLGKDLNEAYLLSRDRAQDLLKDIGERISSGLERIKDILIRRRIEAIAWMLVKGTLEIRVAIPKRTYLGLGNGIFHEKVLVFDDQNGCTVAAAGSANETLAAYSENGENLTVHMSWKEGHREYLERYKSKFESLWSDTHPDYYVLPLPEALETKLKERFYPDSRPELDPLEQREIAQFEPDQDACARLVVTVEPGPVTVVVFVVPAPVTVLVTVLVFVLLLLGRKSKSPPNPSPMPTTPAAARAPLHFMRLLRETALFIPLSCSSDKFITS